MLTWGFPESGSKLMTGLRDLKNLQTFLPSEDYSGATLIIAVDKTFTKSNLLFVAKISA